MNLIFPIVTFLISSPGSKAIVHPRGKKTCTSPEGKKVLAGEWQEGCFVYTCINGKSEEKLTEKCTELIKEHVANILENKLKNCDITKIKKKNLLEVAAPVKYKNPGIIAAGGDGQTQVKLFKLNTKEVCNLPNLPEYFVAPSMDLIEGTPVICGSYYDKSGRSRMKNETDIRPFHADRSCVQLSPASKEAEWTIYAEDLPKKSDHVSMSTPRGLLLMGGSKSKDVTLVKPDGTHQKDVFQLNRFIDCGCGIKDGDTLIITGGGEFRKYRSTATKTVDRYNNKGFVENLPEMMTARTSHGCGYFYQHGKKVLVVAGGYAGKIESFSSTEMLIMGTDAWKGASPLPRGISGFASTSLNNKIYFIVGHESMNEAFVLEFDGEKWTMTLKERYYRMRNHMDGNKAIAVDLDQSFFLFATSCG